MEIQSRIPASTLKGYSPYNHSLVFSFEQALSYEFTNSVVVQLWPYRFWICGTYLLVVFGVRSYMDGRPRFVLKNALTVWSALLAIFAIIGASRLVPELIHRLVNGGLYLSVCDSSFMLKGNVSNFWAWLFALSKLPELGDTLFIVLRKQKLIFLHWYHHLTVLLYCWYAYVDCASPTIWFGAMNYSVHAIMYSYYTLRAAGYRIPQVIAMVITSLQLLQMTVGTMVSLLGVQYLSLGLPCDVKFSNLMYSLGLYITYFVLFFRFFMMTYCGADTKKAKKS